MPPMIEKATSSGSDISGLLLKKIEIGGKLIFSPIDSEIRNILTGEVFKMPPVSARLFSCLLSGVNKIMTREDLMKKVWGNYGFVVGANSINQAIWALREILESAEPGSKYIRTIPRIGYCFIGDVKICKA